MLDLLKMETPKDTDLDGVTIEDVARATHQIGKMVQEHQDQIAEGKRTSEESKAEFDKRMNELGRMHDKLKELRSKVDATTEIQGSYAARKGGLFKKGAPLLDYEDLLALSPESPVVRGEDQDLLKDLQDAHDACVFKYHLECFALNTPDKPQNLRVAEQRVYKGRDFKRYADLVKWTGYANADYGKADEIIHPDAGGAANPLTMSLVSGRVVDLVRINLNVANQFPEFPMQNFDNKLPVNRGDAIGVRGGGADSDPPGPRDHTTSPIPGVDFFGKPSFGTADFLAEDVMAYLWYSDRAVTDTTIAMVPYLRNQIAFMHARAIDKATMSGDEAARTAGAGFDDHATSAKANDATALWNGLRRLGQNYYTDNAGTAITADDVRKMIKRMGVFGQDLKNLRLWMNTGPIYDLMTDPDVTTMDKFGSDAPIKTGALAMVYGVPLLPSEWVPTDTDGTSGLSTAIGTQTVAVMANVSRFMMGVMGGVAIETTRLPMLLSTVIQATGRFDFVPLEAIVGGVFAAGGTVPLDILIDLPA